MINVLIVGNDSNEMYAKAFFNAAKTVSGCNPFFVGTSSRFASVKGNSTKSSFHAVENKLSIGTDVIAINSEIKRLIKTKSINLLFIYCSGNCHVNKHVVLLAHKYHCKVFLYNNDNPYSSYYPPYYWRRFRKLVPIVDMVYSYRTTNINDYERAGAQKIRLLRSYYIESRNYQISRMDMDEEFPEVVFLGHIEDDNREMMITKLLDSGIKIGLPFLGWSKSNVANHKNAVLLKDEQKRYNEYLNKAKIAIVFLSTLNNDTYTRRVFEIPATKTLMLSVYTDDIASMYDEGKEIVFFRNEDELVEKATYYLQNEDERERIAVSGYERLIKDGNEALDRVKSILDDYISY